MYTKILAALLFLPSIALAEPTTDTNLDDAVDAEHESSNRVFYYAHETTLAERDIVSATVRRKVARAEWDAAIRADNSQAAGKWAIAYHAAKRDEADARARAAFFSTERDVARADFRASAKDVRQLTRQARAERAPATMARR